MNKKSKKKNKKKGVLDKWNLIKIILPKTNLILSYLNNFYFFYNIYHYSFFIDFSYYLYNNYCLLHSFFSLVRSFSFIYFSTSFYFIWVGMPFSSNCVYFTSPLNISRGFIFIFSSFYYNFFLSCYSFFFFA
jgi:hypothetical protein